MKRGYDVQTKSFPLSFKLKENIDTEAIIPHIQTIFDYCSQYVDFAQAPVEQMMFADPDLLGETIYEFQDQAGRSRGYTEGYLTVGAATIPRTLEDGRVTNTIVFNVAPLWRMIEACDQGLPLAEWDEFQQFWLYMLIHEFGHCRDNAVRKDLTDRRLDPEEWEDYKELHTYYAGVLVHEFAACAHAGPSVSSALHRHMIENWHKLVDDVVDPLLTRKLSYAIIGLMEDVANAFWVFMVEYAKLVGHTVTNPALGEVPPWPLAGEKVEPALEGIAEVLREIWAGYPDFPSEEQMLERLLPHWHTLTRAHGFIFKEEGEADEEDEEDSESKADHATG